MNPICFFLDHRIEYKRNYIPVCSRCHLEGNDIYATENRTLKYIYYDFRYDFKKWAVRRCDDCKKVKGVMWWSVGDHSKCEELPF